MKLREGTIRHLQEYVDDKEKERGFEDESVQETLLLLAEEVGELINACRNHTGMYVNQHHEPPHEAGDELADVLNVLFAAANKLDIDLEEAHRQKEQEVDARTYDRAQQS